MLKYLRVAPIRSLFLQAAIASIIAAVFMIVEIPILIPENDSRKSTG